MADWLAFSHVTAATARHPTLTRAETITSLVSRLRGRWWHLIPYSPVKGVPVNGHLNDYRHTKQSHSTSTFMFMSMSMSHPNTSNSLPTAILRIPYKSTECSRMPKPAVRIDPQMERTWVQQRHTLSSLLQRKRESVRNEKGRKSASRNLYFQRHQSHCNHHYRRHNHQENNPPVESESESVKSKIT